MDWQIQSLGRVSSVSGERFAPGDIVVCLIYVQVDGELGRADMLEEEEEIFEVEPTSIVGRWKREVKQPGSDNEAKQQSIQSAEDLFLSLFAQEKISPADEPEDLRILKHFLSLMLERKRVIRAVSPRSMKGQQPYIYIKTKENYEVPIVDVTPEALLKVQTIISDLTSL